MTDKTVKLSFCIPIYNFGRFIGETVDSILENLADTMSVEIVVLDGGSTDNTYEVMREYARKSRLIRYIRNETRGGVDLDLHRAVVAAQGEYCWLLSGDDSLKKGAIENLFRFLKNESDVYLCEHTQCDLRLRFLYDYPIFIQRSSIIVDLGEPQVRQKYLTDALNTEACFSFMSGIIVRRDVWLSSEPPEIFKGSCWWHVARLFEKAKQTLRVCYVAEYWVNRRGDNDSFLDRGLVRRLGIAIDGYHDLANYYFGTASSETLQIRRLVRSDIKFVLYMHAKLLTEERPQMERRMDLDRLVRRVYCEPDLPCFAAKCIYFGTPVFIYKAGRWVWRAMRSMIRWVYPFLRGVHAET